MVARTGPKWGTVLGLGLYLLYALAYLIGAYAAGAVQWAVVLAGSIASGLGAGVLFTSYGVYFQATAELWAAHQGKEVHQVTNGLAGAFSAIYLGCEVGFKLLSAALPLEVVLVAYCVCAALAAVAAAVFTAPLEPAAAEPVPRWGASIVASGRLLASSAVCRALLPTQAAFGFAAALLQYFGNAELVPKPADEDRSNVGYAAAIATGAGALTALALAIGGNRVSKVLAVVVSNICFAAVAATVVIGPQERLARWAAVVPLYVVYGAGRGIWESANKALVADAFPGESRAAFANVTWQSGLASALGFFIFPLAPPYAMAAVVLLFSVVAIPGVVFAGRTLGTTTPSDVERRPLLAGGES